MMLQALYIITAILVVLSLLPLSKSEIWWVRSMDFPRLQLATIALAMLFTQLTLLYLGMPVSLAFILATSAVLAYQAWWIAPYLRLYRSEVASVTTPDPANTLRVLTANVLTTNRNSQALTDLVFSHKPDIVLTLESDTWWQQQLSPIKENLPHTVNVPLDNLYGMHLFSRYPLADTEVKHLVQEDVPSIHTAIQLPSGTTVRAHFLHPAPPSPTENSTSEERDAELILVAKSIEEATGPIIVAGDLNDVAWSATTRLFRRISGLLDPRIGRGLLNTFHANYWFIRWPLDHIFHSHHFKIGEFKRLAPFGSDHFAILTELVYDPTTTAEESVVETKEKDKAWAREKMAATDATPSDVPDTT